MRACDQTELCKQCLLERKKTYKFQILQEAELIHGNWRRSKQDGPGPKSHGLYSRRLVLAREIHGASCCLESSSQHGVVVFCGSCNEVYAGSKLSSQVQPSCPSSRGRLFRDGEESTACTRGLWSLVGGRGCKLETGRGREAVEGEFCHRGGRVQS